MLLIRVKLKKEEDVDVADKSQAKEGGRCRCC